MKTNDKHTVLFWRLITAIVCLSWIINFLIRVFIFKELEEASPLSAVFYTGFCALAGIALVVLMIFPYQFYIHALFCWSWGLIRLAGGGDLVALMVHLLSYAFLYRQGFFSNNRRLKTGIGVVILAAAVASQVRFGWTLLIQHLVQFLDLFLIVWVAKAILIPEIRRRDEQRRDMILRLSPEDFSEKDVEILEKLLTGEKYEAIALCNKQAVSTVKKQIHAIFLKLQVNDRISFMARYSNHRIVLEDPTEEGTAIAFPPAP